jgi:hypothetical protein
MADRPDPQPTWPSGGWMDMRQFIPIALALPLAACGANPPEESPANSIDNVVVINVAEPAPSQNRTAEEPPVLAERPLRFTGHWAVDQAACKSPPWKFTEKDLTTKGEVYCRFDGIQAVSGGYDIAAACQSEGNETRETMRLRFAEPAGGMTVESDETYKGIGLIRCGD